MQSKFYVQIHSVPFSHLLSVGPTHLGPNNIFCRLGGGGLNDFGGLKFWVYEQCWDLFGYCIFQLRTKHAVGIIMVSSCKVVTEDMIMFSHVSFFVFVFV